MTRVPHEAVVCGRSDAGSQVRPDDAQQEWRAVRSRLGEAFRRLGDASSTDAVRASAPRELCDACGFTRAMISAVHGTRWVPLVLYTQDALDPEAAAFRAFVESDVEIPLATMLAETEMIRRRRAVLIDDAPLDRRTFKPIVSVARSPGYVAAPLLVDGRAIGFMHADRVGQTRPVSEADRRHIAAFSAELAVLYQQLSWKELLLSRHRLFEDAVAVASRSLVPLTTPAPGLGGGTAVPGRRDAGDVAAPRRDALLSAREREVLELVAKGATNAAIGSRLALSEDTVKSHMRSVLRKLRVSNRGAAVARYVRVQGEGDG
jgi:DNA-binding CsgD family transcriptional regulator